jgi:predicted nucleic acid-binding protein
MTKPRVIVDTSVWVDFLRGSRAGHTAEAEQLIRSGRAATCGVVRAELLAGVRSQQERLLVEEGLGGLDYFEMTERTWTATGELSAFLRTKGRTVPITDCIVAALAIENGCTVLTADNHFRQIPDLRLHPAE